MHCYTYLAFVPACDNTKKSIWQNNMFKTEKRCHLFLNMLRKNSKWQPFSEWQP